MAQTLAEKHFGQGRQTSSNRPGGQVVSENELWSYIVQIASALKAIHEGGPGCADSRIVQGPCDVKEPTAIEWMQYT